MRFLSAGEASGDFFGAALFDRLQAIDPQPCFGLGGPALKAAGQQQLENVLARSAVGLSENVVHVPYFQGLLQRVKAWLRQCRPKIVILVDFQGFNLAIGRYARELGIPVVYFMAPQAWIWRSPGDLKRIGASCDLILSTFAPEHAFYQKHGLPSRFVGHPLRTLLPSPVCNAKSFPQICWLPGSRAIEVQRLTPILRTLIAHYAAHTSYTHVMPVAHPDLQPVLTESFRDLPVTLVPSAQRYQALNQSQQVIGASGSAILEAVLLEKPTVALYQVSALTYQVARRVLKTPWITLPNLLLQAPVVPEFLQQFNSQTLIDCVTQLQPMAFQQAATRLRPLLGSPQALEIAAHTLHAYEHSFF